LGLARIEETVFETPELEEFGEDYQNGEIFRDAVEDVNMSAPRIEPAQSLKKDETFEKLSSLKGPISINNLPSASKSKSGMTSLFMDLLILQRENKIKMSQKFCEFVE